MKTITFNVVLVAVVILLIPIAAEDVCRTDDTACKEPERRQLQKDVDQDIMSVDEMMQKMVTDELFHSQREIANYLELTYLGLENHPDVAKEVRMTAHSLRTQHQMTSGLMKKFTLTAAHIVETMIPMILEAVEDQDKELVVDALELMTADAEDMKRESEETKQNYHKLQGKIQENLNAVHDRRKDVIGETIRIDAEKKKRQDKMTNADLSDKELVNEETLLDEELQTKKLQRDIWMNAAEDLERRARSGRTWFQTFTSVLSGVFGFREERTSSSNANQLKEAVNAIKQADEAVMDVIKLKRTLNERKNRLREEKLENLFIFRELSTKEVSLGDEASLQDALQQLGDVDEQLTQIIDYWGKMAVTTKYLRKEIDSGKLFLKKLEKNAVKFKNSMAKAEDNWKFFGRTCSKYVKESDAQMRKMYRFLSAKTENMDATAKAKRQGELMVEMENNIRETFHDDNDENKN